ncbi:unnamed protein product [Sphacelaria rigidula]
MDPIFQKYFFCRLLAHPNHFPTPSRSLSNTQQV